MVPAAKPFLGSWRIVHMDVWDTDFLDLVEPAHIDFDKQGQGELQFGAVNGWLDCRYSLRDQRPFVEFSWQGVDDTDDACGRGWAIIAPDGSLSGHFFKHCGDDSPFKAHKQ